MGPAGHAVGSGRRVESATAAAHPLRTRRRQGWLCQPQEAMGHEKICGRTSVLEDPQMLCYIVLCMLEKLCGRTNIAPHSAHPLYRLSTACKRKIYQSEKRKVIGQTTLAFVIETDVRFLLGRNVRFFAVPERK